MIYPYTIPLYFFPLSYTQILGYIRSFFFFLRSSLLLHLFTFSSIHANEFSQPERSNRHRAPDSLLHRRPGGKVKASKEWFRSAQCCIAWFLFGSSRRRDCRCWNHPRTCCGGGSGRDRSEIREVRVQIAAVDARFLLGIAVRRAGLQLGCGIWEFGEREGENWSWEKKP